MCSFVFLCRIDSGRSRVPVVSLPEEQLLCQVILFVKGGKEDTVCTLPSCGNVFGGVNLC